jgi:hypothetical protein
MQYYKKVNLEFGGEELKDNFTIKDVIKLLACSEDDATTYINNWISEGYICVVDKKEK